MVLDKIEEMTSYMTPIGVQDCYMRLAVYVSAINRVLGNELLQMAESAYSNNLGILYSKMDIYNYYKEHNSTYEIACKILQADSNNGGALEEMAKYHYRNGNFIDGLHWSERFYLVKGNSSNAYDFLEIQYRNSIVLNMQKEFINYCDKLKTSGDIAPYCNIYKALAIYSTDEVMGNRLLQELEINYRDYYVYGQMEKSEYLIEHKRYTEAERVLEGVIDDKKNSFYISCNLASLYIYQCKYNEAANILEPILGKLLINNIFDLNLLKFKYSSKNEREKEEQFVSEFLYNALKGKAINTNYKYVLYKIISDFRHEGCAYELAKEIFDSGEYHIDSLNDLFVTFIYSKDLDSAYRIITLSDELYLSSADRFQMRTIYNSYLKNNELAVSNAFDSCNEHGSYYQEMCMYLIRNIEIPEKLAELFFDCSIKYHWGHFNCNLYTMLITLKSGSLELTKNVLNSFNSFYNDLLIKPEQRNAYKLGSLYISRCIAYINTSKNEYAEYTKGINELQEYAHIIDDDILEYIFEHYSW